MMDASDVLVERLLAWGVDTIFGLPGDGINGVFEALRKQQDKIRFIHVRHEEAAAFMACAYAKFTGRLGVCIATSGPGGMDIAAGEYGYDCFYFRRMLEAEAVDVLQLDATRCKGFTGFLRGAAIAASFGCPISAHCAPSLHMHAGCAVRGLRHVEYFHDHARIEQMLFDGFISPVNGQLTPDRSRPGLGLKFKRQDAERFAIKGIR